MTATASEEDSSAKDWTEVRDIINELRASLHTCAEYLIKCEEFIKILNNSALPHNNLHHLSKSHPNLKSAQHSLDFVTSQIDRLYKSFSNDQEALEQTVEIKIENEVPTVVEHCNQNMNVKHEMDIKEDMNNDLEDFSEESDSLTKKKMSKKSLSSGKEKNKAVQCQHCERVLISHYHLKKHTEAAHTKFSCNDCTQVFETRKQLKSHIRNLHKINLNNFVCQVCGYTCHDLGPFNRHMLWHSDIRTFKCQHCPRAFHIKYHLEQHLRIHTGEKPYECEVCGKQFARDSHLTRHRVTHSGEKNFSCDVCRKSFTLRENMKRHMKIHENVPATTTN